MMNEQHRLDASGYRALAEFRYQLRQFLQFSEDQARAAGLEPQQHQLLLAIKGLPEGSAPTIRELAGRLLLKHHSTVELVDRLERRGAVRRTANPADARTVLVQLTRTGEQLLAALSQAHSSELETAGPALIKALTAVLRTSRKKGVAA